MYRLMDESVFFRGILSLLFIAILSYSQMVPVTGGTFTMGNGSGDNDEKPSHTITLSPYKIDSREVTFAMYDSCVKKGACAPAHYDDGKCLMWTSSGIRKVRVPLKYRSPDYPVVCVSWHQARQYCRSKGKRLPTEAQWEYAALAGSRKSYAWGNQTPNSTRCVRASNNKPAKPAGFQHNGWGIYDMTGNVWEWTRDRYAKDYYSVSQKQNPSGPTVGRYRAIRGGGWYSTAKQLRIKNRQWFIPEFGEVSIGIRCVK